MTFRTEGDLVYASNQAQALTNLCTAYLELWRVHANGKNGVTVPRTPYTLVFRPMTEGYIHLVIVSTRTEYWEEPEYYDVDSDYFSESWGSSNISGYTTCSQEVIDECGVKIAFSALLLSRTDMEASVKKVAANIAKRQAEEKKANDIAALEKQLNELKAKP